MTNDKHLRSTLDSSPAQTVVDKMWTQILLAEDHAAAHHNRRREKVGSVDKWAAAQRFAFITALVLLVPVALWWGIHIRNAQEEAPLTFQNSSVLPGSIIAAQPQSIQLSDGTQIQLQRDTAIEFVKNTHADVEIAVRNGTAHFDIPSGKKRGWKINCEFAMVEVVGTVFDIEKSAGAVRVSVQRGVVLIRGDNVSGGVQRLSAGHQALIHPKHSASAQSTSLDDVPATSDAVSIPVREPGDEIDTGTPILNTVDSDMTAAIIPTIDELFVLADNARLAGDSQTGLNYLHQILSCYPQHPRAATAAFSIARLYQDAFSTPTRAAEYFERSLSLGLHEPLRETATAKIAEAYLAANNPRYRLAAERYLRLYPTGQYRIQTEAILKERR
ncbi:MAG: FecR domain-containing protein [Deltaproteobacteria bacterium]|nr:FecR domain-containing protein [Deltaproteobacteria bacterium]MBN2673425.1 FecR domain-containing protein [Deltaproteobacteria bacterium]